jgi:hypothetical protein
MHGVHAREVSGIVGRQDLIKDDFGVGKRA